ncbi:hypothetical protein ABLE92_03455 [Gordonia sp. VNQ95]|uniref:hypothetical protein n=1 Tax=Gordonia sp. VNQ95 TaxID=3156619 RepID=UPI0032B3C095
MSVTLHWIPLGAGGRVVARCGRVYESVSARTRHERPAQPVHAALTVVTDGSRYIIEQAPVWGAPPGDRGVRVTGPVGLRLLGRSRYFRYEIRCWRDGLIPDLAAELARCPIPGDDRTAQRIIDATARVPAFTWGRRAPGTTQMWNSNSVAAWLLVTAGIDPPLPPAGCHAPGWDAGRVIARSDQG